MMTLFSILMPLISATAPFALKYCRLGPSFVRALLEPVELVELVEIAIHHHYHFLYLTIFYTDCDDQNFKPASGMPSSFQRINHIEAKNTKCDQKTPSRSSHLRE